MNKFEHNYRLLLEKILNHGRHKQTRTGQTVGLHNELLVVDARPDHFPIITGRKMFWKNVYGEAEWMISGSTNIRELHKYGVHIWDRWVDSEGELGPTYGVQLARQWTRLMEGLIKDKGSRRHVIDLWQVDDLDNMALPPCYFSLVFYYTDHFLNLSVTFRSSDAAVGLPYDVAVLAYILNRVARQVGASAGKLGLFLIDVHINIENVYPAHEYLATQYFPLPTVRWNGEFFHLEDYISGKHIEFEVKP